MFIHVFPWFYREINNILVSFKKIYLMKNGYIDVHLPKTHFFV